MKSAHTPTTYPLLAIDAGNTTVKFAVVKRQGGRPQLLASYPTAKLTANRVRSILRQSGATRAAAASVVPAVTEILCAAQPEIFLVDRQSTLGFPTLVDRRTVGADRLANMAEAVRRYGCSVMVADFGTAATFDVLDERGIFTGGAIAPGVRAFAASLPACTAQLPVAEITKPPRRAGRHTLEAIHAGLGHGYTGLVRHILAAPGFSAKHLVFTGGDAALAKRLTGLRATVAPLWTIRGIAALADQPPH